MIGCDIFLARSNRTTGFPTWSGGLFEQTIQDRRRSQQDIRPHQACETFRRDMTRAEIEKLKVKSAAERGRRAASTL
jgi:hypothetical protein